MPTQSLFGSEFSVHSSVNGADAVDGDLNERLKLYFD